MSRSYQLTRNLKKETIRNFKNSGSKRRKTKKPVKVSDHDFPLKERGRPAPDGVCGVARNKGFVSVGIGNGTAEFTADSILKRWETASEKAYPNAAKIMIIADCGCTNEEKMLEANVGFPR